MSTQVDIKRIHKSELVSRHPVVKNRGNLFLDRAVEGISLILLRSYKDTNDTQLEKDAKRIDELIETLDKYDRAAILDYFQSFGKILAERLH